ncbi:hypothetical protein I317_07087 [Kwoniella heveanensis CBS 569]|nr:hypothetical protein I317_07087 [Kwoniella heveanensis CBS 569]
MESIFEPDSYMLDPSSSASSSSFLSFASFSDLSAPSWNEISIDFKAPPAKSVSDASSPSPSDPFEIVHSAFEYEPATPAESDFGIFHTPTKLSGAFDEQPLHLHHRSSGSTDSWGEPITPSLTGKSFAALSGNNHYPTTTPPSVFSWDESTPSISGSSYTPPTPGQAFRVASNPVIGSTRPVRAVKPISSMPSLREEDSALTGTMFDTSEFLEQPSGPLDVPCDVNEVADGLDWVFGGQYGLSGSGSLNVDDTIFSAFQNEPTNSIAMGHSHSHLGVFPQPSEFSYEQNPDNTSDLASWMTGLPAAPDVVGLGHFDFQQDFQSLGPAFTIDPTAVMGNNSGDEDSRPSSAPGLNGGEGSRSGMLSVPVADVMTRSLSSEGFVPSRNAPPRDLFSYAPQQIPSGPPGPQPLYTSDPSPSYKSLAPSAFPRTMPLTPTPSSSKRTSAANLSIQIHPPAQSTFVPSPFPPTPQSATFPVSLQVAQAQPQAQPLPQPISMQRGATQPLPQTRKLSGVAYPQPAPAANLPPHLARAQAIVQQQEAREQAQRDQARREAASRRVGMAEASVMQPQARRAKPAIMGWEGPSAQTGSMPVLTHTPLVTVHPPPAQYTVTGVPVPVQRVHPPPHPGATVGNRPIARLPSASSPTKARKVSQASPNRTTPSKARSPSGKRKAAAPAAGGFSWGETTFINYTSNDAEKLLTGVAPSGSQSKRKREEEAAARGLPVTSAVGDEERMRSKRSKSDE